MEVGEKMSRVVRVATTCRSICTRGCMVVPLLLLRQRMGPLLTLMVGQSVDGVSMLSLHKILLARACHERSGGCSHSP